MKLLKLITAGVFKFIPVVTIAIFLTAFSIRTIKENPENSLNLLIVTSMAFSVLLFTWAATCEDVTEKIKLVRLGKIFLQCSIFYVLTSGLTMVEIFISPSKSAIDSGWAISTLLIVVEICRGLLVTIGGLKALNALYYLNNKLSDDLGIWDTST